MQSIGKLSQGGSAQGGGPFLLIWRCCIFRLSLDNPFLAPNAVVACFQVSTAIAASSCAAVLENFAVSSYFLLLTVKLTCELLVKPRRSAGDLWLLCFRSETLEDRKTCSV